MQRNDKKVDEAYQRAERRLTGAGGRNLFDKAMRSSFLAMVGTARKNSPAVRGVFRRQIKVRRLELKDTPDRVFWGIEFGWRGTRRFNSIRQALGIEYGTRHIREHRLIRAAWEAHQEEAMATVRRAIQQEIAGIPPVR